MGWTPPSKFIVVFTFLLMAFGIFIILDQFLNVWTALLPNLDFAGYDGWGIITLILFFLIWFLFFLGVKLKGI
ncbi:MAG: hypothetical protein ACFFDF_04725 [Candidatus Odinarchaeota archaeon]